MRYLTTLFLISFFPLVLNCSDKSEIGDEGSVEKIDGEQESHDLLPDEILIYYTCPDPEHKHVHSSTMDQCPECGKTMVKGVVTDENRMAFYGCPMEIHSHIRAAEKGKCPECGMNLKPMRLISS
jgi:hypothetical protein